MIQLREIWLSLITMEGQPYRQMSLGSTRTLREMHHPLHWLCNILYIRLKQYPNMGIAILEATMHTRFRMFFAMICQKSKGNAYAQVENGTNRHSLGIIPLKKNKCRTTEYLESEKANRSQGVALFLPSPGSLARYRQT